VSALLRAAPPTGTVDEPLSRTLAGIAVLVFGGVGAVIAWQAPAGGIAGLWVTLALQLVPGAVVGLYFRLRGVGLWLSTIFGSAALLVLVSLPMAWFSWWHPRPVSTLLLIVTSSFGAVLVSSDARSVRRDASAELAARIRAWTFGPGGVSTLGFALALAAARRGLPQPDGAIVAAGPVAWFGIALIVLSAVWSFGGGGGVGWSTILLSTVVQAVQAMSYRLPTVEVAARHVGVTRLIAESGHVTPTTDIYQAWSGLFASAALVKDASGWDDLLQYAAFWGVVAAAMMMMAVKLLASEFHGERRAWSAALVFGLGSSLNTAFFAPQMFGFVGAVVVIVLMLHLGDPRYGKYVLSDAIVLVSIAVAVTHQLSPYLAFAAVVVLTVFRLIRPWYAGLYLLVPALAFAVVNRQVLGPYLAGHDLGQFLQNLLPPSHSESSALQPSLINRLTFGVPAAALVLIGLSAVLVLWRVRTKRIVALTLAAASPGALFFGSSYGNEGVFRVALFALPWLAILAAYLLPEPGRRFWTVRLHPVRAVAVLLLTIVQIIGCTGMDYSRVIRPTDVAAITWIERNTPQGSYVFMLGTDLSEPLYVTGRLLPYISRETLFKKDPPSYPSQTGAAYDPKADLARLTDAWATQPTNHVFVLATDQMRIFDERYGQQLASDQARLEAQLRATTASWKVVYDQPGARVYEFLGVVP